MSAQDAASPAGREDDVAHRYLCDPVLRPRAVAALRSGCSTGLMRQPHPSPWRMKPNEGYWWVLVDVTLVNAGTVEPRPRPCTFGRCRAGTSPGSPAALPPRRGRPAGWTGDHRSSPKQKRRPLVCHRRRRARRALGGGDVTIAGDGRAIPIISLLRQVSGFAVLVGVRTEPQRGVRPEGHRRVCVRAVRYWVSTSTDRADPRAEDWRTVFSSGRALPPPPNCKTNDPLLFTSVRSKVHPETR